MPDPTEQNDVVKEARELLVAIDRGNRVGHAFKLLKTLADEVERQRDALIRLRDSTNDMWACSFAGEILQGATIDDALDHPATSHR